LFLWKNVFLFHILGKQFLLSFLGEENIFTEEGSEKMFTSTMKIPAPPSPQDEKMVVALEYGIN
jgi:hypothetical protein